MGNEAEQCKDRNQWYALQDKWHKYYASSHQILLVGDGDFSFSLCLANSFGSASNIVATSLDSYAVLIRNYKRAKKNVMRLKKRGATVLHEVDATKMKLHPDIGMRKFDRIIYNFPHAGFHGKENDLHLISKHRKLVSGFLQNARRLLRPDGQIHVNHKTTGPYTFWNLPELGSMNYLISLKPVEFKIKDFPGYENKRGDSLRCDEPFPLGKCSTFIFVLSKNMHTISLQKIPFPHRGRSLINDCYEPEFIRYSFGIIRPHVPDFPGIIRSPPPPPHPFTMVDTMLECSPQIPRHINMPCERYGSFDECLNHVEETFGKPRQVKSGGKHLRSYDGYSNHVEETFLNPRHVNMLSERRGSFDGYLNRDEETFGKQTQVNLGGEHLRCYDGYSNNAEEMLPNQRQINKLSERRGSLDGYSNHVEETFLTPRHINMRSESCRSFDGDSNRVERAFGTPKIDVPYSVHEALDMRNECLRSSDGYSINAEKSFGKPEIDEPYPFRGARRLWF